MNKNLQQLERHNIHFPVVIVTVASNDSSSTKLMHSHIYCIKHLKQKVPSLDAA